MDMIKLVTINSNGRRVTTKMTVDELIDAWFSEDDIPTNDDEIVTCIIGSTRMSFKTFGDLMQSLYW